MGWVAEGFSPTPEQGALLRGPNLPPPHPAPRRTPWTPPSHSTPPSSHQAGVAETQGGPRTRGQKVGPGPWVPQGYLECSVWPQAQTLVA